MIEVKVYSFPTCHACQEVKEFLKKSNILFTDHDVSSNEELKMELIKKSGQLSVPVIFVGGEMVLGFDKPKLSELIGI